MWLLSIDQILIYLPIGQNGYPLSYIEAAGTLFGLLCIYLASIEKVSNYFFGLLNVTLFAIIFFQLHLYASLLLQIFFFVANIYGWIAWSAHVPGQHEKTLKIRWLSKSHRTIWLVVCLFFIGGLTYSIDTVFLELSRAFVYVLNLLTIPVTLPEQVPDPHPFWDASLLILSIAAQILMTRKYVENWFLWFIINVISVGLFVQQGVYVMALEYVLLLIISTNGIRVWVKTAQKNRSEPLLHNKK